LEFFTNEIYPSPSTIDRSPKKVHNPVLSAHLRMRRTHSFLREFFPGNTHPASAMATAMRKKTGPVETGPAFSVDFFVYLSGCVR
jgi:hypothetical protein